MVRVLIGMGITIVGILTVWKSDWFLSNFGAVEWAEKYLGTEGGTRLYYKLLGIAIIFLGFFVISGIWNDLGRGFANLFGGPLK